MSLQKTKCDPTLGQAIHEYLKKQGVETPTVETGNLSNEEKIGLIEENVRQIMETLGLDLTDDSLAETPKRVAKMYVNEIFWGLEAANFPKATTVENKIAYNQMVMEKDVTIMSACEHHLVTIDGFAHIAYIPKDKVLGLSKLNRIAEYFARRPQIQERLTVQIAKALEFILGTPDVAVVIDAEHYCVKSRGVEDHGSHTVTSYLGGSFRDNPVCRQEFMALINSK